MVFRRFILFVSTLCLLAGASVKLNASETFQFGFRLGGSGLDTTYKYNPRASARIREAFASLSGASVTVTAYSSPDGKFSLNRQLAALRAASVQDFLESLSSDPVAINTVIVPEDWEGVKRYFKRSNLEWKDEALEILSSRSGDKKALLQDLWVGEAWEDLMKNCFPALRRVTVSVDKNATVDAPEAVSGAASIVFKSGSSALFASLANNSTEFSSLAQLAKSGNPTLYIYVKSSPEGEEASNEKLSLKRADRIKAKLLALGYSGEVIPVYEGEDWDGLATAVRESSDLPDKDAVLDILSDKSLDRASRKHALQKISYGRTWLRLMEEEMSGLRKAVVSPDKH